MIQTTAQSENELLIIAAGHIAEIILNTLHAQGSLVLGIVGGRTIPALFERLAAYAPQFKEQGHIDLFWLDERIGAEKNYIPLLPHLEQLHHSGADIQWHPLQSTHKQAMEIEAKQTESHLHAASAMADGTGSPTPHFDIVICSAGEDGHIASLFPNHPSLQSTHHGYIIEEHSPKAPPLRVTIAPPLLQNAKHAVLFFIGDKQAAYNAFTQQETTSMQCPAKLLQQNPEVHVFSCLR